MKAKLFFLCFSVWAVYAEDGMVPLVILFSGSANGVLRTCHCPSNPWGGLAKRAWLMNELRAVAGTDRVLALDSGDLFPVNATLEQQVLLLQLFYRMRYQAVAIGDQELMSGYQGWLEINKRAGFWDTALDRSTFPWLTCDNRFIAGLRNETAPVKRWTVLERAGRRIGIISVCGSKQGEPATAPEGACLTPPADVIRDFRNLCKGRLDLLVVLSHQGLDEDRLLATRCVGIDVIIGGHSQSLLVPPEMINGTIICQAGKNGENLGVLLLAPRSSLFTGDRTRITSCQAAEPNRVTDGETCMFRTSTLETPRWRIAQRIIPLTEQMDESSDVGELISQYYATLDNQNAIRLKNAVSPKTRRSVPQIILNMPTNPVPLDARSNREIAIPVSNRGTSGLLVSQVRSRSPWLKVIFVPTAIAPGATSEIRFTLSGASSDRLARSEFTVRSNDPERPVIQAAFPAVVKGVRPQSINVKDLWQELCSELFSVTNGQCSAVEPLLDVPVPGSSPSIVPGSLLLVEYYYSPECEECQEIETTVIDPLVKQFEGLLVLQKHDVTVAKNYERLTRLRDNHPGHTGTTLAVVIGGTHTLFGADVIRQEVPLIIEEITENRLPRR